MAYLYYSTNDMAADFQENQGTRASTAMALVQFARKIQCDWCPGKARNQGINIHGIAAIARKIRFSPPDGLRWYSLRIMKAIHNVKQE